MPAALKLQRFGSLLWDVFGEPAYQVGSSLRGREWRDVDVRLLLDESNYGAWGLGDPNRPHDNSKWCGLVMAFSALGREMTGLPIDFQIQETVTANAQFDGPRSCLADFTRRTAAPDAEGL